MRLCINMLIFTHNLGNWLIYTFHITLQASAFMLLQYTTKHEYFASIKFSRFEKKLRN